MPVNLENYYRKLEECRRCPAMPDAAAYRALGAFRTPRMHPIPERPKVLLVFETPGLAAGGGGRTGRLTPANEDQTALRLREYLMIAGLSTHEIAFANSVSCPAFAMEGGKLEMRTPTGGEIRNCAPYITELAGVLGVRYIGAAGGSAVTSVLGPKAPKLTDLYRRFLSDGPVPVREGLSMIPLFHTSPLGIMNIRKAARVLGLPDLDDRLWRRLGEIVASASP